MPKEAIGSKKTQGADNTQVVKRFTNGHKTFTAMEGLALTQAITAEDRRSHQFETRKHTMTRPRNPLTGESTPRDGQGVQPLLPPNKSEVREHPEPVIAPKIGSVETYEGSRPQTVLKRELTRLRSLQYSQDSVAGELEYIRAKMAERETKVQLSLLRNRLKG